MKTCSLHSRGLIWCKKNDVSLLKIPLIEPMTHNGEYMCLDQTTRARQMDHVIGRSCYSTLERRFNDIEHYLPKLKN